MQIVVALDKFKGTLTALQACAAVQRGLARALPAASFAIHPVADGGDGTLDALAAAIDGRRVAARVWNPLMTEEIDADILLAGDLAFLEVAAASGIVLLDKDARDPLRATTYGTGQLIQLALDHGVRKIVIGLGGSATNDGGIGIAQALGYTFLDGKGKTLERIPADLANLDSIQRPKALPKVEWIALADVANPLLGPNGATAVYGPQKGVTDKTHALLEHGLAHFADVVQREFHLDYRNVPGAGAAGGCGFGLMSFFGAEVRPGFEFLAAMSGLDAAIAEADFVVTGEGLLDAQTLNGKAPAGVAAMAKRHGKPVAAIGGGIIASDRESLSETFQPLLALTDAVPLEVALNNAGTVLEKQAEMLGGLLQRQRY